MPQEIIDPGLQVSYRGADAHLSGQHQSIQSIARRLDISRKAERDYSFRDDLDQPLVRNRTEKTHG